MSLDNSQKKSFYILIGVFNIGFSLGLGECLEIVINSSLIARGLPLVLGIFLSLWAIVFVQGKLPISKGIPYSFFQLIFLSVATYGMSYENIYACTEGLVFVKRFIVFSVITTLIFLVMIEWIIHYEKRRFQQVNTKDFISIRTYNLQLAGVILSVFLGYCVFVIISKGILFLEVKRYYAAIMILFIGIMSMEGILQLIKFMIKKRA